MRILVAETDLEFLAAAKVALEAVGHEVTVANDGMGAWGYLAGTAPPDVLVTRLPGRWLIGSDGFRQIPAARCRHFFELTPDGGRPNNPEVRASGVVASPRRAAAGRRLFSCPDKKLATIFHCRL